jgi:hypothetical protein
VHTQHAPDAERGVPELPVDERLGEHDAGLRGVSAWFVTASESEPHTRQLTNINDDMRILNLSKKAS